MSSGLVRGERPGYTRSEQALRGLAALLAVISAGFAVWYVVKGFQGPAEYPYVTNSVAKDVLLAGLAWLVVWDVRRWAAVAVPPIVAAHAVMPIVLLATAQWGAVRGIGHTWSGPPASATGFRWQWLAADVGMVIAFLGLHFLAVRSRYGLRYLTPSGFRALMALADVLVLRKDREVAAAEVGVRVDRYLARFQAHDKYRIRLVFLALAFWPLLTLHPPFHVMSVTLRQRWVQRRFLDDTRDWLMPRVLRDLRRAMIRTAQQFCFFGYYADERAAERAGYLPFSRRDGYARLLERVTPNRPGVTCMSSADIAGENLNAQVVVVGTGAGGSMLASELAARGREVLLLERGRHVDPSTFTESEADQLSALYADGALTLTRDFRFQVAQGMCVGGSTVINNAVCFDLPEHVRERWLGAELAAGLDRHRLDRAFRDVREFLQISPLGPRERRNPGAEQLIAAMRGPASGDLADRFSVVDCNIVDCLGSGYCNIGCKFGKKLSALDWTLPRAQREHPGRVRVLPECRVDRVLRRDGRAVGVQARLGDGRPLTVRADTVVLSAGAIASSLILQRSGLGEGRAGQSLSFNMASPVTLDFAERVHSERGAQISHALYLEPTDGREEGLALETWFNPIVSQSLFMPGWFEEHWDNMRRYANMTCLGVVVGTQSNGRVSPKRFGTGFTLDYEPTDKDFVALKEGVKLACRIGLDAKALRVMPSTFRVLEINSPRELGLVDSEIGDDSDISINSAHPQGGNPMSDRADKGVVDPSFRVYGTQNVYVCDASVFPSSITVNPQLTVMALAMLAADEIAGPRPAAATAARPAQGRGSMSHLGVSGPGS